MLAQEIRSPPPRVKTGGFRDVPSCYEAFIQNPLLSVADHCLRSRNYVNVIVVGKQPGLQYLDMDAAIKHCTAGIGIWEWASNDRGAEPDVVMVCAGDVPTVETLAAISLLRQHVAALKVRVINVVNLMKLQPQSQHPHGLPDPEFDALFTTDEPIIFAFHGYPWLIHRLTYRRTNHGNLHVRGYNKLIEHQQYIERYGEDMPEVREWTWTGA